MQGRRLSLPGEHPLDRKARLSALRKCILDADPRKALLQSSKHSASHRKIPHDLTLEDVVIPTHCPVLGIPLSHRGRRADSPTLDRVDSTRGYVKGNVKVISWRANRLKSDGTLNELEKIVAYIRKELTNTAK